MLGIFLSLFFVISLSPARAGKIIVANNTRITYDFGHEVQPYIANEVKFVSDRSTTVFDANKFRIGFRYKINDYVRIDPHLFIDNKLKDAWQLSPGPGIRIDLTY